MLLSVVMPCYHGEPTLARAIESVVPFLRGGNELVIVFDGNEEEGSYALAKTYAEQYPTIQLIYPRERMGAFKTRQRGILEAKGDYCAFLDADDYFAVDAYETIAKVLNNTEADILNFSFYVTKEGKDAPNFFVRPAHTMDAAQGLRALLGDSYIRGFLPCKVIKTGLLRHTYSLRGDDALFEDTMVCVLSFLGAEKIAYIPKPLYHYVHGSATQSTVRRRKNRTMYHLAAFAAVRLHLESLGNEKALRYFFQAKFRSYLSVLYDLSCDKKGGLTPTEEKALKREFNAIFGKKPLLLDTVSYRDHLPERFVR